MISSRPGEIAVLDKLLKYWPLFTVAALAVVSVFNVGYFSIVGLHFIGVMDLSNIVYSVGLVMGLIIAPLIAFPDNLGDGLREFAAKPDAVMRMNRIMRVIVGLLTIFFMIGLFVHQPYISIIGLFALTFLIGYIAVAVYSYVWWLHAKSLPARAVFSLAVFGTFTTLWVGAAVAYHEAFGATALYNVTTKDTIFENVRLARSSSSGFIVARDKKIIYIPSGEIKSITLVEPVDKNP
jgi:lysylphosphatidylglycerol synthetase-like protein (DUF2156 family)